MVSKYLLPGFFLLLPFQWALFSSGTHDVSLLRLWALVLVGLWSVTVLVQKKRVLLPPLPLFLLTGFLILSGVSVAVATYPQAAFSKYVFWLNFFPLLLVFFDLLREPLQRERVLRALAFGAAVSAAIGCLQFLSQFVLGIETAYALWTAPLPLFLGENFAASVMQYPSFLVNVGGVTLLRASAFFPDPHMYAYYLGMTLPVAGWLALKEHKRFWYGASVLIALVLLLTFSRSAYIALIGLGIFFGGMTIREKYTVSLKTLFFGTVLLGMLVVSPVSQRLLSSFSFEDHSVVERTRLAREAIINLGEHPWFGVGLGNYPFVVKPTATEREPIYVHNLYLDLAVELGIIGLVAFVSLVGLGFGRNNSSLSRSPEGLSLIFFLTQSLFENPLFSIHILPLFILFLALRLHIRYA